MARRRRGRSLLRDLLNPVPEPRSRVSCPILSWFASCKRPMNRGSCPCGAPFEPSPPTLLDCSTSQSQVHSALSTRLEPAGFYTSRCVVLVSPGPHSAPLGCRFPGKKAAAPGRCTVPYHTTLRSVPIRVFGGIASTCCCNDWAPEVSLLAAF